MAWLHPGLHPNGLASADSGWPYVLRRFATEAWRHAGAGGLEGHSAAGPQSNQDAETDKGMKTREWGWKSSGLDASG